MKSDELYGKPVIALEDLEVRFPPDSVEVFVAVGYSKMNRIRENIFNEVKSKGYIFASFVHPSVKIWSSTILGENVFIFEDNTIQPFTSIGNNTVLWSGNHLGHHSRVGNNSFISSHVVISGSCVVGNNVFIGVNATLRDGITIGDYCLIGAGAIVMKDTFEKEAYIPDKTNSFRKNTDQLNF